MTTRTLLTSEARSDAELLGTNEPLSAPAWWDDVPPLEGDALSAWQAIRAMPITKGPGVGEGATLGSRWMIWQDVLVRQLFGRRTAEGRRQIETVYCEMPKKSGKAESIENLIPTPDGFTKMGEVAVGDLVIGANGEPTRVVAATPILYGEPCYEVEFATGDRIVVSGDHLWAIRTRKTVENRNRPWSTEEDELLASSYPAGGGHHRAVRRLSEPRRTAMEPVPTVLATRDMAKHVRVGDGYRYRVALGGPLVLPEAELPIPPYTFGAWLGDGNAGTGYLSAGEVDGPEIRRLIEAEGVAVRSISAKPGMYRYYALMSPVVRERSPFKRCLRELGLGGRKWIPVSYLRASGPQRLTLLRGLMDTDGTIGEKGGCSFETTNWRLSNDVAELIATLGIKATRTEKLAVIDGRVIATSYRVSFHPPAGCVVFGLRRKAERQRARKRGTRTDWRSIVAIRRVSSVPVRCITVAAEDGLYRTGRSMIVTHNSHFASALGLYMLGGREEYGGEVYCLDPDTPVLCADDLRWKPIGDVDVGDRLLSVDEEGPAFRSPRKMRTATVTDVRVQKARTWVLHFGDGRSVICTANHRWLSLRPVSPTHHWRRLARLGPGYRVRSLFPPWADDWSYAAGYLAGAFDGEGCYHAARSPGSAYRLAFSQKPGLMMDGVTRALRDLGFDPGPHKVNRRSGVHYLNLTGLPEVMRFLGSIRPIRLLDGHRDLWEGKSPHIPGGGHEVIEAIEPAGVRDVVDISTTTGTFVANGFVSHNSAGYNQAQAKVTWGIARDMVSLEPHLRKYFDVKDYRNQILMPRLNGRWEPLTRQELGQHGFNPFFVIFDELHTQQSREMWDAIKRSMAARDEPLLFAITNAGFDRSSVCWDVRDYALRVNAGEIDDPSFLGVVYGAREEDDWTEEETWRRANPGLGVTARVDRVRAECEEAKSQPSAQNSFLRWHLSIWTQQDTRWLSPELWAACDGGYRADDLAGALCYGGLDLGSTDDLAAWVKSFPDEEDPFLVRFVCDAWCAESRLTDRSNPYRAQYAAWAREGWLTVLPGDVIDYGPIREKILADAEAFKLKDLGIDVAFQGNQLMVELGQDHGLTVVKMRTTYQDMTAPCDELERRMRLDPPRILHDGNPVLAWAIGNVALRQPDPDRKRPVKDGNNLHAKIDPVVALLMALDRAMRNHGRGRSRWEEPGAELGAV